MIYVWYKCVRCKCWSLTPECWCGGRAVKVRTKGGK